MTEAAVGKRIEAAATCLSWIPPQAVEGALKLGPGAIFDPATRTNESKEHVRARAKTHCRLAVVSRDQLDSQALLGVAAQQTSRLRDLLGG